jgi:ketosteroid isomerase-like protein
MATDEDFVSPEKPMPPEPPGDVRENLDLEEFFHRLPSNLRWPKPNEEMVAAAVEAIQRLSASPGTDEPSGGMPPSDLPLTDRASCPGCRQPLGEGVTFCGHCGLPVSDTASGVSAQTHSPETRQHQHHYHHHYHHFVPAQGAGSMWPGAEAAPTASAARSAGTPGKGSTGGRSEQAARQLVQDWAQACNTKHLDDLLELYAADATVIRSNIPPVRSLPAIREFLFSLLEAGLGDVEMESLRTEVLGEIALELGRCKMLVPLAMGKRREERGKYLLVLARQPAGAWKILADCWSSDLAVSTQAPPEAGRKAPDATGPARKVR